ncbi:MAG: UrcA family protein [Steroidobacteraceae bacterium]|jgi:UrcA family protein
MSSHESIHDAAVSRPAVTLMMILCGVAAAAAAGAVSAATPGDDAPRIVVRYSADSLATDSGARQLYSRLVHAAEQVCPAEFTGSRLLSPAVLRCREQSIARAVHQIDNPRLAEVYATSAKRG